MGKASSKDDQPSSGSSSSSDAGPEASTAPTAGEPLRLQCVVCAKPRAQTQPPWQSQTLQEGVSSLGGSTANDDEMARVPEGRIDMVCFNVFRALGCSSFGIFSGVRSANNFFNPKSPSLWP